eukprot:768615-Rhodomonas_salina.2
MRPAYDPMAALLQNGAKSEGGKTRRHPPPQPEHLDNRVKRRWFEIPRSRARSETGNARRLCLHCCNNATLQHCARVQKLKLEEQCGNWWTFSHTGGPPAVTVQ